MSIVKKVISKLNKVSQDKISFEIQDDLKELITKVPEDFKKYITEKYKQADVQILVWLLDKIAEGNSHLTKKNIDKGIWIVKEIETLKGKDFVKSHIPDKYLRSSLGLNY